MKIRILFVLILLLMLCGCSTEEKQTNYCAVCGGVADTTLSGPLELVTSKGISVSDCKEVTAGIYTAHICERCLGPVFDPFA